MIELAFLNYFIRTVNNKVLAYYLVGYILIKWIYADKLKRFIYLCFLQFILESREFVVFLKGEVFPSLSSYL